MDAVSSHFILICQVWNVQGALALQPFVSAQVDNDLDLLPGAGVAWIIASGLPQFARSFDAVPSRHLFIGQDAMKDIRCLREMALRGFPRAFATQNPTFTFDTNGRK